MSRIYPSSNPRIALMSFLGVLVGGVVGMLLGHYGFGQGWIATVVTLAPVVVILGVLQYLRQRR